MKKSENSWKKTTLKRVLDSFQDCYYFTKEALALRGIPDIIGCWNGKFFALECKKSAHEKSISKALQAFILERIRACGGFAEFIYPENHEEVLTALKKHCTKLES